MTEWTCVVIILFKFNGIQTRSFKSLLLLNRDRTRYSQCPFPGLVLLALLRQAFPGPMNHPRP